MTDLLPDALRAMLSHAEETQKSLQNTKAEEEYLLTLNYSCTVYHEASPITGIVLTKLARFYESIGDKTNAAITLGRINAILAEHTMPKL